MLIWAIPNLSSMNGIVKTIHTYAGLLTFVNLMVFGVAGWLALFQNEPGQRAARATAVYTRPLAVEPNLTDLQVAQRVVADLGLTLATPVHDFVIKHDAQNRLWLDLWHANGTHKVTILENERLIRVEEYRNSLWDYLDVLHATTAVFKSDDWRMQLWAYYNEFAMWNLLAMMASGAYLWLSVRARHRLAQWSLASGAALVAVLLWWTR
jgi:hypothetical protein